MRPGDAILRLMARPGDPQALAWVAINSTTSARDALLLLAEDVHTDAEAIAAAQRYVQRWDGRRA